MNLRTVLGQPLDIVNSGSECVSDARVSGNFALPQLQQQVINASAPELVQNNVGSLRTSLPSQSQEDFGLPQLMNTGMYYFYSFLGMSFALDAFV